MAVPRKIASRLALHGVPSGPTWLPRPRRARLLALLACRDDIEYLPGYLANVGPHVDGVVALDDRSSDGSRELLESSPRVLEVLRAPPTGREWDEVGNYLQLVAAALRHGAEWAISLDADERVERDFRRRTERVVARGRPFGFSAYAVRMRELWDGPAHFRVDGIWGEKRPPRLFRVKEGQAFDTRPLHSSKVPLQVGGRSGLARADLEVYHLRMIRPEDRRARRERYERLDPEARWQPREGYAYLTDETGIELREVSARRPWVE